MLVVWNWQKSLTTIYSLISIITLISISNCTCKPVNCHRRRNRNEIYDFPETLSDHQKLEKKYLNVIDKDVKPLVTYQIDHVGRMELVKKSYNHILVN